LETAQKSIHLAPKPIDFVPNVEGILRKKKPALAPADAGAETEEGDDHTSNLHCLQKLTEVNDPDIHDMEEQVPEPDPLNREIDTFVKTGSPQPAGTEPLQEDDYDPPVASSGFGDDDAGGGFGSFGRGDNFFDKYAPPLLFC
jgi:hypothetical protein